MPADKNSKHSFTKKTALLILMAVLAATQAEAGLFSRSSRNSHNNNSLKMNTEAANNNRNVAMATLFDVEDKQNSAAADPYLFAQNHYGLARAKLQTACRAISSFYNHNGIRDILQKVFIIDTQFFKEDIKNSASAVKLLSQLNFTTGQGLRELSSVIAAPGTETLANLEEVVARIRVSNRNFKNTAKKYTDATDKSIEIARAAYETFELIPSLSLQSPDFFIQTSKQVMSTTQSNAEAFKGILLNVLSGCEQIELGLAEITKNVKDSIRYSDNFAVKQYPLINLPAPTREKIFVQLNSMANYVKNAENTIAIGDSQIKNQARQFSTHIGAFTDKAAESLKYSPRGEMPLEQISTYARNQVNGLFLRVKEDILAMRAKMQEKPAPDGLVSSIVTPQDIQVQRTMALSRDKLPLFLLGGKHIGGSSDLSTLQASAPSPATKPSSGPDMSQFIKLTPKQETRDSMNFAVSQAAAAPISDDLFGSDDFNSMEPNFGQSEMSIISSELGKNFFSEENSSDVCRDTLLASGEDLPAYGEETVSTNESNKSKKHENKITSEMTDPELEMLRFASE